MGVGVEGGTTGEREEERAKRVGREEGGRDKEKEKEGGERRRKRK